MTAPNPLQPSKGEAPLSRFALGRELARGGMGAVHIANDRETGQQVALKLLLESTDPETRQRFLREQQAASALACPWICRPVAWGMGSDTEQAFLAMEFVDGPTLHAVGKGARAAADGARVYGMPAVVGAEILRQLLLGLGVAHKAGVLHRDLKPANVMLDKTGRVKLVDFGIARRFSDATLTRTGQLVGTPAFMSPEQVRGEPLDVRSDLFSLGLTVQAALTGTHRFSTTDQTAMLLRAMSEQPSPTFANDAAASITLDSVLATLTALDREARVPDADAALQALVESGLLDRDGEHLLAAWVADHIAGTHDLARACNLRDAQHELARADVLAKVSGAEAAVVIALSRAVALTGGDPAQAHPQQRLQAFAEAHDLAIDVPHDAAIAQQAADQEADAARSWRDPVRAAACALGASRTYQRGRAPRRQATCLWRYVRTRPDDALALQQLEVLLDGPPQRTTGRLSTRSIVAGVRTAGAIGTGSRAGTTGLAVPVRGGPAAHERGELPPMVMLKDDGIERSATTASRLLIGSMLAGATIVLLLTVRGVGKPPTPPVPQIDAVVQANEVSSRLRQADAALFRSDWALARTLATEVLTMAPTLDEGQRARAIRARAHVALKETDLARRDLEEYVAKVRLDSDPFLIEANRLLALLSKPPAAGTLR